MDCIKNNICIVFAGSFVHWMLGDDAGNPHHADHIDQCASFPLWRG